MMTVPTIDIGPYFDSEPAGRRSIAAKIGEACETIGFFAVENHRLDRVLIETAFATAAEFFDQPPEVKARWQPASSAAARGFHRLGTKALAKTLGKVTPPDLREQFYIGPLENRLTRYGQHPEATSLYAPNIWPTSPAGYQPVFSALYLALESLAVDLMRLFALALDLDEHFFDRQIDGHFSTLPVNDYPTLDYTPEPHQLRCGEHTDFGSLTILAIAGGESGLQVKTRAGDWIDVAPETGQFVVNIGDMMQRWTNDRWLSNLHRVTNPATAGTQLRRQSLGYFLHPNFDARIACLPSCRDAGQPPKYPAELAGRLMAQKLRARAA